MSKVLVGIDKSKSFRFYLTITTDIVEEARRIHDLSPLASAGLGRVLTATGMMSIMMKNDSDRLTVQFKGDGPARQIIACAYGDGRVRGYIANPHVDLPPNDKGKLDVGGSLGTGELTVIRDIGLKEPYSGTIALVDGEIADDLTAYYYISEQQNTSIALGVKVGRQEKIIAAGGMFIQMLPDADPESVDALEVMLRDMKPITTHVEQTVLSGAGKTQEGLLETMMHGIFDVMPQDFAPEVLGFRDIRWECDCSRERMARALMTIGRSELEAIIEEDGEAELGCQFCRSKYHFTKEELQEILSHVGR
ncbi:MAG: Hsp33 family molecular chaperone HslO [Anaerovoracaceae bacterium]|jgi:molecular chaperone Hsp33